MALASAYYVFPGHHLALWSPLGFLASLAVLAGVWLNRPTRRWAWVILSLALLAFITGDTLYNVYVDVLGRENPYPSISDAFYLLTYPLFAAGLILVQSRAAWRDRDGLLDALIITTGVGFLSWAYLIEPYVHDESLSLVQKMVSVAYPLGDVLVLVILIRLVGNGGMRVVAVQLLSLGAIGLLTADVFYGLIQLHGSWATNGPVDIGWIVFYISWGAAALHPSMTGIGEVTPAPSADLPRRRLVLLALASLLSPLVLMIEAARGAVRDAGTAAGFSVVMFLLVLLRLESVLAVHRQSIARERALRAAAMDIGGATDHEQLYLAIVRSARRLRPPSSPARAELHLCEAGELSEVAAYGDITMASSRIGRRPVLFSGPVQVERGEGWVRFSALFNAGPDAVLSLTSRSVPDETADALKAIAAQAAVAVESARLADDLQRQRSDTHFRTLVQNASDVILITDANGLLRYVSPSAERILGLPSAEVTGRPIHDFLHPLDRPGFSDVLAAVSTDLETDRAAADWRLVHLDGTYHAYEALFSNLLNDATVEGIVLTLRDVTERRNLEQELIHQAFHDPLTGLANRALFRERVKQALDRQSATGLVVAALLIDLDDFKLVNDTRGHAVGDDLLVCVAAEITAALRLEGTAARLGGDEFAILIETDDPQEVRDTADRLLSALTRPLLVRGDLTQVGACIGTAVSSPDQEEALDSVELLRRADLALYAGKEHGKNCVVEFRPDLHTQMMQRAGMRTALQQALELDEFILVYQPIVTLETGQLVGVEALIRWNHPTNGLVLPQEFIALAEENGLIVPIGAWVLDTACRQMGLWAEQFPGNALRMNVNVSGRQIEEPGFAALVQDSLSQNDVPADRLVLEITEGVLLGEDTAVVNSLRVVRELGVTIALDDFGTGYSSLGYLPRLPVDLLKIDRSFVMGLSSDRANDGTPARTVVALAQHLGVAVVAEGIETMSQRAELQRLGCRLGQGYLFSPPLPPSRLAALLASSPDGTLPFSSALSDLPRQSGSPASPTFDGGVRKTGKVAGEGRDAWEDGSTPGVQIPKDLV
ncbi:hypothetical protein GCM10022223_53890 [Kineosporia mesophila]|uniref:Diguanylate cyclase/phosphodiesterase with PAS/PAC sensor(S) n=1 Tax=Kineosporia mesophila TaxID=566012 RepID=A0ABP7ACQ0_9ACTN|nr:GGDEF domain-containing phosphodiesterase [Kineosporia mesophila]MCD5351233.1 EAL domain-containing protein [Kineosporia mesophila]